MTGTSAIAHDCEEELGGKKMYAARYATIMR
jgi:hypothetical protein